MVDFLWMWCQNAWIKKLHSALFEGTLAMTESMLPSHSQRKYRCALKSGNSGLSRAVVSLELESINICRIG
jgi:hypothetical protein